MQGVARSGQSQLSAISSNAQQVARVKNLDIFYPISQNRFVETFRISSSAVTVLLTLATADFCAMNVLCLAVAVPLAASLPLAGGSS